MNTKSFVTVPIEISTFLGLSDFLREQRSEYDPVGAINFAIDYWMENASWKEDFLQPGVPKQADKGYHWKNVFMPNGTSLRMKYNGELFYAAVQGDKVIFDGEEVSPSGFTFAVSQTSRNAWKDIWIKRPNDFEWVFAETLRNPK